VRGLSRGSTAVDFIETRVSALVKLVPGYA